MKELFLYVSYLGAQAFYFVGGENLKLKGKDLHKIQSVTEADLKKKAMAVIDFVDEPTEFWFFNDLNEIDEVFQQGWEINIVPVANISIIK